MINMQNYIYIISTWLRIPSYWLNWPDIISYIIIPFILIWFAFYKLLEKIHIFERNGFLNKIMATVFAFVCLQFGSIASMGAAAFIGIISLNTWKSRILFFALIAIFYIIYLYYHL